MAVENAHWIMYAIGENEPNHHVISVKGDTTINGMGYKKTWRQQIQNNIISPATFLPPFFVHPGNLIGAMRDDTLARQVFYIPFTPFYTGNDTCDIFEEWLIYDFSINVGDTIGGCLQYEPNYPFTALSITSENLWGQDRTVIDCDGSARLMEGVGTDMGPFWQIFAYPHPAKPTFLYDYCGLEDGYCGLQLVNGIRQRLADWQIELTPNPATDLLTLQFPEGIHGPFSCTVSDFTGKMVFVKNAEPIHSRLQISIKDMPSGIYVLTIRNENAAVARRFAKL
ncbi:MAG: T9SS type A sorting domain-containing protein [Saprospiraceae bacterium]|nr:T9SS type A sorting domain-containing protein [Saprospiraceae bacterium]